MVNRKKASGNLDAIAECNAEVALIELVNEQLNNCLRPIHKPSRGGHDRIIVKTLRKLPSDTNKIIFFIDYEEDRVARKYTEQICNKDISVIHEIPIGAGASILVCKTIRKIGERSLEIYSVIWRPKSEDVLLAARILENNPESLKKAKNDKFFIKKKIKETRPDLVEKISEKLCSLLGVECKNR